MAAHIDRAMTNTTLTIDFGEVGYWNEKHRFSFRIDAGPLLDLIDHSKDGYRCYELFLIRRSGDIWDYLQVTLMDIPPRVASRIDYRREKRTSHDDRIAMTLTDFDRLFCPAGDDTFPEDERWLSARDTNAELADYLSAQFKVVVEAKQALASAIDKLLRAEILQIGNGDHPYDRLPAARAIEASRSYPQSNSRHTESFFEKLEELVADCDLTSAFYKGNGDRRVLSVLCAEQIRRVAASGHKPEHCLALGAKTNSQIDSRAVSAEIAFFSEGIGYGDLYIEDNDFGAPLSEILGKYMLQPGKFIFSAGDQGELPGYQREEGEGWFLYTKDLPYGRRGSITTLSRTAAAASPKVRYILTDRGGKVYQHEHVVFILGSDIAGPQSIRITELVTKGAIEGVTPLVLNLSEFMGCDSSILVKRIRQSIKSIDVLILLNLNAVDSMHIIPLISINERLWSPWVVSNRFIEEIDPDLVEDVDADVFVEKSLARLAKSN